MHFVYMCVSLCACVWNSFAMSFEIGQGHKIEGSRETIKIDSDIVPNSGKKGPKHTFSLFFLFHTQYIVVPYK